MSTRTISSWMGSSMWSDFFPPKTTARTSSPIQKSFPLQFSSNFRFRAKTPPSKM